jgi:hypothetical protein
MLFLYNLSSYGDFVYILKTSWRGQQMSLYMIQKTLVISACSSNSVRFCCPGRMSGVRISTATAAHGYYSKFLVLQLKWSHRSHRVLVSNTCSVPARQVGSYPQFWVKILIYQEYDEKPRLKSANKTTTPLFGVESAGNFQRGHRQSWKTRREWCSRVLFVAVYCRDRFLHLPHSLPLI